MSAETYNPEQVAYETLLEAIEAYSSLYPGCPDLGMEALGSKLLEVSQERHTGGWAGYISYLMRASG